MSDYTMSRMPGGCHPKAGTPMPSAHLWAWARVVSSGADGHSTKSAPIRNAQGVALGDRLAQKLHERRVDARVRDAAGRENKPHPCLLYVAVMTPSSRAGRTDAREDRLDTTAKLIAVTTPQPPARTTGMSARANCADRPDR